MKHLVSVCIITPNLARLRAFYQAVLQAAPQDEGEDYTSFVCSGIGLNLYSTCEMEAHAPGSMAYAGSGNFVLEIGVEDPDLEYQHLLRLGAEIVVPPTTYEWGRRAVWFRDPDGNLVSFSCSVQ